MQLGFRAILFDLDGTLLDSLEDIARSANQVLRQLGHPVHPLQAYKLFIGDGLSVLFQRALPPGKQGKDVIDQCLKEFESVYSQGWDISTKAYNGIPELLDALSATAIDLAILSNKPDPFAKKCVNKFLAEWKFRVVFGDRPGIPRKPDPAGAQEIAQQLDLRPEHVLYLGDTAVDMLTAKRAGMYPVGASWGFRTAEELWSNGAEKVVSHPLELLSILERATD
jgi:phosphoglycolate phosphatase